MKTKAIALCRVSTPEQRDNNSLTRQEASVRKAADRLDVEIVRYWTGDISSKVGKNFGRRDLLEMYEVCKKDRSIRYLIVDEVDRFMRDLETMFYWRVKLREELKVQVWFADNEELNQDSSQSRLLLSFDAFKAEGSNEERQRKSVKGHEAAIKEGRYTFPPKPGYMKGNLPGIHIRCPNTFEPFQKALKEVLSAVYTPLEALKRLNASKFTTNHAPMNMDKFKQFLVDPYYAGIVEINKQVKMRNEYGLHEAMITKSEHLRLVALMDNSIKRRGPKKQYNPEFPMNKILTCDDCGSEIKFTGSRKSNGYQRKTTTYYYKYECRGCHKSYHRDKVHQAITKRLGQIDYHGEQAQGFIEALQIVWEQKQQDKLQHIRNLQKQLEGLAVKKSELVNELPGADLELKSDIKDEIIKVKKAISDVEQKVAEASGLEQDLVEFVKFGLEYTNILKDDWWDLDHEDRVRCQQLIIPGGISYNAAEKVGTPKISSLYTFQPNKKDLWYDQKSLMVEMPGTAPGSEK